jgi:hypothetical protein
MNLSAAIKILDTISPKHLRGSDPASLSKFMELCHHWQMAALDEVNRGTREVADRDWLPVGGHHP